MSFLLTVLFLSSLGLDSEHEAYETTWDEEKWQTSPVVDEPPPPLPSKEVPVKTKRSSLGRLWKKMIGKTKRSSKSIETSGSRPQSNECDGPLAPPPPLSYLVSRSNGSDRVALGRHVSSPSIPTNASAHQPRSATLPFTTQYANAPLSAPSLFMPSPSTATSGRFSPRTSLISEDRRFSAPVDEVEVYTEDSYDRRDGQRAVHSMYATRPPEINYPYGQETWRNVATHSPAALSAKTTRGRQNLSTTSIDKELPAVPGEQFPTMNSQPSLRPASAYNVPYRAVTTPWTMDERRQSSASLHARPSMQTMVSGPPQGAQTQDLVPPPILSHYGLGEFGVSTGSLGRWDDEVKPTFTVVTEKSNRRRSRLANIASIFTGSTRRSVERERQVKASTSQGSDFTPSEGPVYPRHLGHQTFPMTTHPSYSETALRKSTSSAVSLSRTSKASMSRYADLIPQENELVAVRYPTEEEREDLMRYRP